MGPPGRESISDADPLPFRLTPIDFTAEREKCIKEGSLFKDPYFPADPTWKRPGELTDNPIFLDDCLSRFDITQGELGDCYMLAAAALLAQREDLFYQVVPREQSFTENYAGIFRFNFWWNGRWISVVIDDRLPCWDGQLCNVSSSSKNEFWSALLEKAYAKLYGSYTIITSGVVGEALEDFTGGISEQINLYPEWNTMPNYLEQIVRRGLDMGSLIGCGIYMHSNESVFTGLAKGHAYSLTGLEEVITDKGKIWLVRIRNPWGNEREWNVAWSDKSTEWEQLSEEVKMKLEIKIEADGEFWMSFADFVKHFDLLDICNLDPDATLYDYDKYPEELLSTKTFHGALMNTQSPGCFCKLIRFPQYFFMLSGVDADKKCTVIVTLTTKKFREQKLDYRLIVISIYEVRMLTIHGYIVSF